MEKLPPEIVKEHLKSIISSEFEDHQPPEAIFVLSGGIVPDQKGGYKSPSYSEVDDHGFVTGGKARSIAAAKIAELFPEIRFVTTSRRSSQEPTHAQTMAQEMVRFGADEEQIILEENSWDTFSEMVEAIELAEKNGWGRVAFITNDYHIPRAKMFFDRMADLAQDNEPLVERINDFKSQVQASFIPAETILENISGHYKHLIDTAKSTDAYQQRLEAEKRGINALQSGNYRVGKDPMAETIMPDSM